LPATSGVNFDHREMRPTIPQQAGNPRVKMMRDYVLVHGVAPRADAINTLPKHALLLIGMSCGEACPSRLVILRTRALRHLLCCRPLYNISLAKELQQGARSTMKIAVLDDYQQVALKMADWSAVRALAPIDIFSQPLSTQSAPGALAGYTVVCLMRERMPFGRELIEQLPNLKLICITGPHNRTLDLHTASERGITVCFTEFNAHSAHATPELAWGLILAAANTSPRKIRACATADGKRPSVRPCTARLWGCSGSVALAAGWPRLAPRLE
jgi:hypothetical protein